MLRQTSSVVLRNKALRGSLSSATEEPTDIKTLQADTIREALSLSMLAPASSNIVTEKHSQAKLIVSIIIL